MHSSLEQRISNLLQKCTFTQLKQIHALITTTSLNRDIRISTKTLRRSTEFGGMDYSELLFSQMDEIFPADLLLWNAMIRGYAFNGPYDKCISMHHQMIQRGLKPNNYTYPYLLNSCAQIGIGCHLQGMKMHCQIIKVGFERAPAVSNSLLNFYMYMESSCDYFVLGVRKNEKPSDAQKVFDDMLLKPVQIWNRMIWGCINIGDVESARKLFDNMPERDIVSWNSMISGYAKIGNVEKANELFMQMSEKNVVTWTSMVGAFSNSGDLQTAKRLFLEMPYRNVISWNSMISSYTRHGKFQEALELFVEMHLQGVNPDGFTFVSALSACSNLGALEFGKWIHFYLIRDWCQLGVIVGTALIEMYAKCGDVDRAFKIFIKLGEKDVFCWNVMMKSLAIHGRTRDAIKIFFMMQGRGLKPNEFTFTSALFACNHGGLIEEGRQIFSSMKDLGISPKLEHYGCLVDLLGRNGQVEEAKLLVEGMPFEPDIAVWGALLGGCRVKGDLRLAEEVMERIDELKTNESGVYVLLSNIYASAGQWPKAVNAREKMEDKKIWKRTGCSSVLGVVNI
ncbi:PREDICTED: pentatricopeptide repeat-containing protein At3g29230-like [Nelumbo nucifera]|uniref:Pentatricopeptide repeat-containing protein At3g29230-like n=2 Tax=Nelumbo nucifera TaxID=4432 RepID=A0A822XMV8_NELNU|nr:PREDICTED: pentatricopeptide repeat-containing protein At3g29230-like [Nelumbo nucifera]DAD18858.1 TPA_asm: hypothetical protein HUJ06_020321 [Nelumbo nucifera]